MTRRFQLLTHLTFPLELCAAPGARHHLAGPGDVVELDDERCRAHDRFLRGRLRAGDLVELELAPAPAQPAELAAAPAVRTALVNVVELEAAPAAPGDLVKLEVAPAAPAQPAELAAAPVMRTAPAGALA